MHDDDFCEDCHLEAQYESRYEYDDWGGEVIEEEYCDEDDEDCDED
jgi:hypothetical protein